MLTDNNIPCIAVHGETRPMHRKGLMDKYQNGNVNIMICTDLGSRGINTIRVSFIHLFFTMYISISYCRDS